MGRKRVPFRAALVASALFSLLMMRPLPIGADALPSLEVLESFVGEGPELLAALSALERDEHLRCLQEQRMGPRLFGGLTYGYSDEPVSETAEEKLSYRKVTARAGVAFPLLGTWNREKIDLLQAELRVLEGRTLAEETASRNLTALRKAYGLLWFEGRRQALLEDFLEEEPAVEAVLAERVRKGHLLEADRLEFLSAFDVVRRDLAASRRREIQALQALHLATGRSWEVEGALPPPLLPGPLPDDEAFLSAIGSFAEIRRNEGALALKRNICEVSRRLDREASLELGVAVGRDFPGETGTGVYLGFVVREPFGVLRAREDQARLAAEADLKRQRWEGLATRIRLEGELMESLALREQALASIEAGGRRLAAAQEALRVSTLRHGALAGDTFEKLQQSRYGSLRVALDLLEAQALLFQTETELVRFAFPPGGPLPGGRFLPPELAGADLPPDASRPAGRQLPEMTAYVWDASPFLEGATRRAALEEFRREGFRRMLLSFTGAQIRRFREKEGRRDLESLLAAAESRGIAVDLLLGDPAWILPERRHELIGLIRELSSFPFRGLHLDLEPDSLPEARERRRDLAAELIRTVEAVRISSTLPLSLSVHPRELEGELGELVGPGLKRAGVEEVTVMIYSTNAEAVIRRFQRIREVHSDLRPALAQSVEGLLSPRESWADQGREVFRGHVARLEERLGGDGFGGIFVQAWKDYREMRP
ncbi:MAG: hypothetical protein PHF19_02415 [Synergistales bacterium]|nr:hypothetical protein [Synergistales bacterium]